MNLAELLETLNYTEGEYLSLNHQPANNRNIFTTRVLAYNNTVNHTALTLSDNTDTWFGVNPTTGPARTNSGRGGAEHVTRLAALWCDLDVKLGACRDLEHAHRIINALSETLQTRPSAITYSGHGLQPYWPIDDGHITNTEQRTHAGALLKRWGRLAVLVASGQGARIDAGVYDLARVLRVPGTVNHKHTPVPVTCQPENGGPLTLNELAERLDELGVTEYDSDRHTPNDIISHPQRWRRDATSECSYFKHTAKAWRNEPVTERHPWLLTQAVRIMAGLRNGCFTAEQYDKTHQTVVNRFVVECVRDNRAVPTWEIPNAFAWAQDHVSRMSDTQIAAEIGGHLHPEQRVQKQQVTLAATTTPTNNQQTSSNSSSQQATNTTTEAVLADTGNADLLVSAYADTLRWCPQMGRWLLWNNQHWKPSIDGGEAIAKARHVIESIEIDTGDKHLAKHKLASMSRRALNDMTALARCNPAMRVDLDTLDAHPYELNTPDGIIDLHTGTLTPHTPDRWHTKITGTGYAPDDPAPQWFAYLHQTFGGDNTLVQYVQRLAGYAATGKVTHHILPFLFGAGDNGKSVLLDVFGEILGDYAITAPADFLLAGRDRHETEIARLHGARFVACSEINADSKFNEARVKLLTGGDPLSGRFMRQDFFDFLPSHTLFLMGNHQPEVSAGGPSFFRRLRLIPFLHQVPESQRVEGLAAQLVAAEGKAILAWIVEGARQVLTNGLQEPASVLAATAQYQEDTRTGVAKFLDDCCTLGGGESEATAVYQCYVRWAYTAGETPVNTNRFGREMTANQVGRRRDSSARYYLVRVHPERLSAND